MKEPPDSLGSSPEADLREKMRIDHIKNQMKHMKTDPSLLITLLNSTKRKTNAGVNPIPYVRIIPKRIDIKLNCSIFLPF